MQFILKLLLLDNDQFITEPRKDLDNARNLEYKTWLLGQHTSLLNMCI